MKDRDQNQQIERKARRQEEKKEGGRNKRTNLEKAGRIKTA